MEHTKEPDALTWAIIVSFAILVILVVAIAMT